jgi:hypothetical protein
MQYFRIFLKGADINKYVLLRLKVFLNDMFSHVLSLKFHITPHFWYSHGMYDVLLSLLFWFFLSILFIFFFAEKRTEAISWPPLEASLKKYQDTANADQIMKIQVNEIFM